jgi:hypothetical protein
MHIHAFSDEVETLLDDPMTLAIMRADKVDIVSLKTTLARAAVALKRGHGRRDVLSFDVSRDLSAPAACLWTPSRRGNLGGAFAGASTRACGAP